MPAMARVRLVVPVVPDTARTGRPRLWTLAIDVPPVPTTTSFLAAAASIEARFTSSGSQLTRNKPSMAPAWMERAISRSSSRAFSLTSRKGPSWMTVGVLPSSTYTAAGMSCRATSMDALAATKRTWATVMPADSACRMTSSIRWTGSLPPRLYRLPPLEPIKAIRGPMERIPFPVNTGRVRPRAGSPAAGGILCGSQLLCGWRRSSRCPSRISRRSSTRLRSTVCDRPGNHVPGSQGFFHPSTVVIRCPLRSCHGPSTTQETQAFRNSATQCTGRRRIRADPSTGRASNSTPSHFPAATLDHNAAGSVVPQSRRRAEWARRPNRAYPRRTSRSFPTPHGQPSLDAGRPR